MHAIIIVFRMGRKGVTHPPAAFSLSFNPEDTG